MFHTLFDDPLRFLLPGLVAGAGAVWALQQLRRTEHRRAALASAVVLLALWAAFVTFAALIGPSNLATGLPRPSFALVPFSSFSSGRTLEEVVGNLMLFLPMGALLPLVSARFRSMWLVCSIAFAFSFGLELAQYAMNVGRLSDVDDAIINTVGAALGWLTWRIVELLPIGRPSATPA